MRDEITAQVLYALNNDVDVETIKAVTGKTVDEIAAIREKYLDEWREDQEA